MCVKLFGPRAPLPFLANEVKPRSHISVLYKQSRPASARPCKWPTRRSWCASRMSAAPVDTSQCRGLESEARQKRKLAAALRKSPHEEAVDVNGGSDAELLRRLAGIRKFPRSVAARIVSLRPFSSRTDLLLRVNTGCRSTQDRIGPAFIPMLRVEGMHMPPYHVPYHIPSSLTTSRLLRRC